MEILATDPESVNVFRKNYEIFDMIEQKNSSSTRTHQCIINEYWGEISSTFTSLGAVPPNQELITNSTRWRYCQTENKKDRKKVGFICELNWTNHNIPFVKITVNNFKAGKETFNSLVLDKERKASNISSEQSLPKSVIDALNKERQEKAKIEEEKEAKRREALFKEKLHLWTQASNDIQQHPYAEKKRLLNNELMRQHNKELLYPLTSIETGEFCGIQTIHENGDKRFFGQQKNAYSLFGNLDKAAFVYLCEGYATANAIFQMAHHSAPFAVINTLNCGFVS